MDGMRRTDHRWIDLIETNVDYGWMWPLRSLTKALSLHCGWKLETGTGRTCKDMHTSLTGDRLVTCPEWM